MTTVLAVYSGAEVFNLTRVAGDYNQGPGGSSQVVFSAIAGTVYQIAVDSLYSTPGDITLKINPPVAAPIIIHSPASINCYLGERLSYYVQATSTAPVTYQWKKNGVNLVDDARVSGATGYALSLSSLEASDTGVYTVDVTNLGGTATSAAATFTVITPPPPVLTTQPVDQSVYVGERFDFSVVTQNTGPTTFQWQKSTNGGVSFVDIPGARLNSYGKADSQNSDAGQYRVIVTNGGGSTTSSVATITTLTPAPPAISIQPANTTVQNGIPCSLSA